jgi:anti-sigma factor RsiW
MNTMHCNHLREQFAERLDGRLDEPQREAFDRHVAVCPECAREWQAYAAVWQTLTRVAAPAPSVGFVERTLRRLDEAPEPLLLRWRPLVWRWALVGSTAIVMATSGWLVWQRVQSQRAAEIYASMNHMEFAEDFDVIESLDLIEKQGRL